MLAERLDQMVDQGLFERREYCEHPPRDEYRLTDAGLDLFTLTVALMQRGERWVLHDRPLLLHHRDDLGSVSAVFVCDACDEEITVRDVECTPPPNDTTQTLEALSGGPHRPRLTEPQPRVGRSWDAIRLEDDAAMRHLVLCRPDQLRQIGVDDVEVRFLTLSHSSRPAASRSPAANSTSHGTAVKREAARSVQRVGWAHAGLRVNENTDAIAVITEPGSTIGASATIHTRRRRHARSDLPPRWPDGSSRYHHDP